MKKKNKIESPAAGLEPPILIRKVLIFWPEHNLYRVTNIQTSQISRVGLKAILISCQNEELSQLFMPKVATCSLRRPAFKLYLSGEHLKIKSSFCGDKKRCTVN